MTLKDQIALEHKKAFLTDLRKQARDSRKRWQEDIAIAQALPPALFRLKFDRFNRDGRNAEYMSFMEFSADTVECALRILEKLPLLDVDLWQFESLKTLVIPAMLRDEMSCAISDDPGTWQPLSGKHWLKLAGGGLADPAVAFLSAYLLCAGEPMLIRVCITEELPGRIRKRWEGELIKFEIVLLNQAYKTIWPKQVKLHQYGFEFRHMPKMLCLPAVINKPKKKKENENV